MITIKNYTPAAREACLDLFQSNLPKYFAPEELQLFVNWLDKPELADYYLLEAAGEIIGCGGFYALPEQKLAILAWGMIHATHHGKGFGRLLTQYRLEAMQEQYPDYERRLSTSQHTYGFYQKMGYTVLEIVQNGFGPGLDKYVMGFRP